MSVQPGRIPLWGIALLLTGIAPARAQEPSDLFQETERQGTFTPKREPTVARERRIVVDLARLRGPSNATLRLPLFDGLSVLAVKDHQEQPRPKTFVWYGHLADKPGTTVVLANVDDALAATFWVPIHGRLGLYGIRYRGGGVHVLWELIPERFLPDEPRGPQRLAFDTAPSTCSDPPDSIDAMILYTDDVLKNSASVSAVESEIEDALALTNQSYANSDIEQRLHLVHVAKVEYNESRDAEKDRDRLQNPSDGFLDDVPTLRDAVGADVVALIVERIDGACGWSFVMDDVTPSFASKAYAVVRRSCAADNLSLAHELGHIMGAHHDRVTDGAEDAPGFNYGFVKRRPTAPGDPWRTVMAGDRQCRRAPAVDCVRIPFWSNPNKNAPAAYGGDAMGVAGSVDNHQRLKNTAKTVANFRCGSPAGGEGPAPTPTRVP